MIATPRKQTPLSVIISKNERATGNTIVDLRGIAMDRPEARGRVSSAASAARSGYTPPSG